MTAGPLPACPPMPLPDVLEPLRRDLERVEEAYGRILAELPPETAALVADAARFSGKRLRPALACIAARAAGAEVVGPVATVAAIVELIHTATLVHDDVIDGAALRRRQPTLNARVGQTTAVLVGDVLFSRAYAAAAWLEDRFPARYLSAVVGEVLEGEILQDLVARQADLPLATYERIIDGKTAALYEAALRVGAHAGGASSTLEEALSRYGRHVGRAFQMVDDRLDLEGEEAAVGKSVGTDLAEGKTTLAVILWRESKPLGERAAAEASIRAAWADVAAARRLRDRIRADGGIELAQQRAQAEVAAAESELRHVPAGIERDLLLRLARYTLDRAL